MLIDAYDEEANEMVANIWGNRYLATTQKLK